MFYPNVLFSGVKWSKLLNLCWQEQYNICCALSVGYFTRFNSFAGDNIAILVHRLDQHQPAWTSMLV